MSVNLGNTSIGSLYLGSTKVGAAYLGNVKVWEAGLPAKTVRFDFHYDNFDPTTLTDYGGIGATWTHVEDDVYDFYFNDTDWGARTWSHLRGETSSLFRTYSSTKTDRPFRTHSFDILDANLEGVTNVRMLLNPTMLGLQSIASIRNTSSVTNFNRFLQSDTGSAITSIPLFDTSSAVDVSYMFYGTGNVETGALAMYTQMSTQTNPPTNYSDCFTNCGSNTVTGAAELAQIPTSWGGTMA